MRQATVIAPDLVAIVQRLVREALGTEAIALDPIAGQLGRRRFLRVRLACDYPASAIAPLMPREPPMSSARP